MRPKIIQITTITRIYNDRYSGGHITEIIIHALSNEGKVYIQERSPKTGEFEWILIDKGILPETAE